VRKDGIHSNLSSPGLELNPVDNSFRIRDRVRNHGDGRRVSSSESKPRYDLPETECTGVMMSINRRIASNPIAADMFAPKNLLLASGQRQLTDFGIKVAAPACGQSIEGVGRRSRRLKIRERVKRVLPSRRQVC